MEHTGNHKIIQTVKKDKMIYIYIKLVN